MAAHHAAHARVVAFAQRRRIAVKAHPAGIQRGVRRGVVLYEPFCPVVHLQSALGKGRQLERGNGCKGMLAPHAPQLAPQVARKGHAKPGAQPSHSGAHRGKLVPARFVAGLEGAHALVAYQHNLVKMAQQPRQLLHHKGIGPSIGLDSAVAQINQRSRHAIPTFPNASFSTPCQDMCSLA